VSAAKVVEKDPPEWVRVETEVVGPKGKRDVPALIHPWCPGLAVTMSRFGFFCVTHVRSGLVVGGAYERAANAKRELCQSAAIGKAIGLDWATATADQVVQAIIAHADAPVPFKGFTEMDAQGTRPVSIRWWMHLVRDPSADEFDFFDDDPHADIHELLQALEPAEVES
jgi:hypothetical protein